MGEWREGAASLGLPYLPYLPCLFLEKVIEKRRGEKKEKERELLKVFSKQTRQVRQPRQTAPNPAPLLNLQSALFVSWTPLSKARLRQIEHFLPENLNLVYRCLYFAVIRQLSIKYKDPLIQFRLTFFLPPH